MGCLTAITYCARVCVCTGSVLPLLLSFTLTVSPAASAYQAEKVQEKAQSQVNTYSEVGKQGQLCASPSTYRCVPHRPHTVVCLTVHIPLCASPSTYLPTHSVVVVVNCVTHLSVAPLELQTFKVRRVAAFKKNLVELTELQLKHARVSGAQAVGAVFLGHRLRCSSSCLLLGTE